MPPCLDVYIRVRTDDVPAVLSRFIDRYVDVDDAGDPRFSAFVGKFVNRDPATGDDEALADLRRDVSTRSTAFSLYVRAKEYEGAIITVTDEGNLVLGLSVDDPDNSPATVQEGASLLATLTSEFGADGGVAGVELAPPQSASEWASDALVLLRTGSN